MNHRLAHLTVIMVAIAGCGSIYDTKDTAPTAWVTTYSEPAKAAGTRNVVAPTNAGSAVTSDDVAARLREAAKLRDDGLVSEKEYQQLRQRILQQF